ncbi:MAG: hypothetical protein ACRDYU_01150 [Actinomycetes bacterium]
MFRGLRGPDGRPTLRTRVLAVVVVLGLAVLSAPALIPVLRWTINLLLP